MEQPAQQIAQGQGKPTAPGEVCITHCSYLGYGQVGSAVYGMCLSEVFPNLGAEGKKLKEMLRVLNLWQVF